MPHEIAVVIPTRNRPDKLVQCLAALSAARERVAFTAHVCDASDTDDLRQAVARACDAHPFARVQPHRGRNVAAARNHCAHVADAALLVNVDDDVYVEPGAVRSLLEAYRRASGLRVVSGSVHWEGWWTQPMVKGWMGHSRPARPGEEPTFVNGAFFIYPRAFAMSWPWNERIRVSDDVFVSSVWRSHGVKLLGEPRARAFHDDQRVTYGPDDSESHVYALLFDALMANPSPARAIAYETLGFVAAARATSRGEEHGLRRHTRAWIRGHRGLLRDRTYLRELLRRPLSEAV